MSDKEKEQAGTLRDAADVLRELTRGPMFNTPDWTHYRVMAAGLEKLAGKLEDRP